MITMQLDPIIDIKNLTIEIPIKSGRKIVSKVFYLRDKAIESVFGFRKGSFERSISEPTTKQEARLNKFRKAIMRRGNK